ncbi:uncharacterized protein LOC114317690 [Camellia sinensis]|uniref:uncharacterized protein LOC114317690 n=1 Tax=Camellia sinensis TaxID=4442 RepID=UPI001036E89A|nr:uncharacterized protein LOC114317690 [Camellia sinensis]
MAKQPTIRIFLSIDLQFQWPIKQLDISTAFLHGILQEEVYMLQPLGFVQSSTHGFTNSLSDTSLFIRKTSTSLIILLVDVNDILLTSNDSTLIAQLLQQMHKVFSKKELGSLSYFLGISVHSHKHGYFLSQAKYAAALLHKPPLYRSLVGGLQYLTITRPDLSYVVNQACQFMHLSTNAHFQAVKRLLRYVKGTLSHGLSFTPSPFDLSAFLDSNWASDSFDKKSTSGYYVYLGSNLISWSAKKQATVSWSSSEADLSAMALASNLVFHSRSKHIEIDCHCIREKVVAKQIELKYIPTIDQVIDIFTKPFCLSRFHYLRDKLLVLPCPINLREAEEVISSSPSHSTQLSSSSSSSHSKPELLPLFVITSAS